jgi:pimeloyl-ACP methyl ester carboxylesterase
MTPAETLLFLPGASGNVELWRPVSERIRHPGSRRILGWPGFGGLPADGRVTGIDDLVTLVTAEITGPADLFAQSMGGVVALRAAIERPSLVRHLVLSVTSGGIDVAALGGIDWRPTFRARNPSLPSWFEEERSDLSARLHEVKAPVLLLWGDADPISPVGVGRRLAQLLPDAELVVFEGGTHDLVFERADDVVPHIERHLRGPNRSG